MSQKHKDILIKGNAAISNGNNEGFLEHCTDDTQWIFVGERTLNGKQEVREYMAAMYKEPPRFTVHNLIAEGDYLTAVGEITMKDEQGISTKYSYCDVWRFREDKLAELRAFVVKV
jgi:uncharacterized protein